MASDREDAITTIARLLTGEVGANCCHLTGGRGRPDGKHCGCREVAADAIDALTAAGWSPPEPASGAQQAGDVRERVARAIREAPMRATLMNPDRIDTQATLTDGDYLRADAAIRALPAPEVTEEMVRAGLRAEWRATCGNPECCPPPDYDEGDRRIMRAILTAALRPGEGSR